MPRYTERTRRARAVIQAYVQYRRYRMARQQRSRQQAAPPPAILSDSSSLSSISSLSTSSSGGSDNSEPDDDYPLDDDLEELLPELIPVEYMDEPGDLDPLPQDPDFLTAALDTELDEVLGMDWENEADLGLADDEGSEDEDEEDRAPQVRVPTGPPPTRIGRHVCHTLEDMYARRYETARNTLPRAPGFLPHILHAYKNTRPDKFREQLRVTPTTFDRLVARLQADPVFANNSDNAQMPVEEQVAIALYRFGHYGNAASLQEVANWAGCGKGTVDLVTRRVMTAILRSDFLEEYVRYPTPAEKERAKEWVESHSCRAWRNGWCMVDGTLVPFDERPFWYGESYFDRKCNYSLNIQV